MSDILKETELTSLPGKYEWNPEKDGENELREKITYNPERFDYPDNKQSPEKGYSFYHHDAFKDAKDEAFANHTFIGLNPNMDPNNLAVNETVDSLNLVLFTALKAPNGKYLKSIGDKIFAVTNSDEVLTDKNIFKIYRSVRSGVGNDRNSGFSYVISQGSKYATVKTLMNRFNVELKGILTGDKRGTQHYRVYQIPGTNRICIYSMMKNPWDATVKYMNGNADLSANTLNTVNNVQRFWSIYDGESSDLLPYHGNRYPEYIYESDFPYPNMLKVIGNVYNEKYDNTGTALKRVSNNYLFEAGVLSERERYITIGYDGKIRWVKYFNEFYDKFFNADVTPDKVIELIKPSVIYECPYKAVMDANGFKADFMELKNVMTPGYGYGVFDKKVDIVDNH